MAAHAANSVDARQAHNTTCHNRCRACPFPHTRPISYGSQVKHLSQMLLNFISGGVGGNLGIHRPTFVRVTGTLIARGRGETRGPAQYTTERQSAALLRQGAGRSEGRKADLCLLRLPPPLLLHCHARRQRGGDRRLDVHMGGSALSADAATLVEDRIGAEAVEAFADLVDESRRAQSRA